MNGLAIAALVLVSVWLGVLTLVILALVRQVGVLTVRLSLTRSHVSLADDGPEVGSQLPPAVISDLPSLGRGRVYLTLLSASCMPCRALAAELSGRHFNATLIALVSGRDKLTDGFAALLPSGIQIVRDPIATRLAAALQIKSTPFAVVIENTIVTGKTYLHSAGDLDELIESRKEPELGHIRYVPEEMSHVR